MIRKTFIFKDETSYNRFKRAIQFNDKGQIIKNAKALPIIIKELNNLQKQTNNAIAKKDRKLAYQNARRLDSEAKLLKDITNLLFNQLYDVFNNTRDFTDASTPISNEQKKLIIPALKKAGNIHYLLGDYEFNFHFPQEDLNKVVMKTTQGLDNSPNSIHYIDSIVSGNGTQMELTNSTYGLQKTLFNYKKALKNFSSAKVLKKADASWVNKKTRDIQKAVDLLENLIQAVNKAIKLNK